MTAVRLVTAMAAVAVLSGCGGGGAGATADPQSEEDKTLYAMGYMMGKRAESFDLTKEEANIVARGFYDAATGQKPAAPPEQFGQKVAQMQQQRMSARASAEKEKAKPYLEAAAKEEGAETTGSGLVFRSLTAGTGANPAATDKVRVHYRGTLIDGTEFDSSYERNKPAEFALNRVVKCWQEGIPKMKVGGKAKLVCPSTIAYGDRGQPPDIPGGAALTFEVELLGILPPSPPGAAPGGKTPIRLPMPGGQIPPRPPR